MLSLAQPIANPSPVEASLTADSADWAFGNFMLAWLDAEPSPRLIRHLPDASFFLSLLRITYAPVLEAHPQFAVLLEDRSRPEMSITNDVLQIQLNGLVEGYSMIRHHALMLFTAALWLDEPQRTGWLALYDELVTYADSLPGGRPSLTELARIERQGFEDFVTLAPRTLNPDDAEMLLGETETLKDIVGYQLYAAVAIGLLWREYRALDENEQDAWYRTQLSHLYVTDNYLEEIWTATP